MRVAVDLASHPIVPAKMKIWTFVALFYKIMKVALVIASSIIVPAKRTIAD